MTFNARTRAIGVVIIIVAAAAVWWFAAHKTSAPAPPAAAPAVSTTRVRFGTIDVTVAAVGRLGAAAGAETKLAFATSGRIGSIRVRVGERVNAGEALAALDTAPLSLTAQQANADARAASAQAAAAAVDRTSTKIAVDEAAVSRASRLYAAGVAAGKDVQAAQAQLAADRAEAKTNTAGVQAAQAQALSAQAKAQLADRDLANGTLRSPTDGVVTSIMHQVGESVDPTIAVIGIAPGSNSQVTLQVAGTDAMRVRAGDAVRLTVPSTGNRIAGRVTGVSGAVDPTTQSAQILVEAAVPAALAGSAVDAEIVVAHDRGILVPKQAVIADPATQKTLVFVQRKDKDGNATFDGRDVHVVFENGTNAEVTGLRAGDTIASAGGFQLLAPAGGN
ncbi:MAG TPA: efflux RND transporter periplasmic adaptor subunit [Candidatus Baltobacteraceae bacterium]|jgi:multidrug efflux pump subunit AcrA (membrane-fusion protein)|nr:efflux RND transporter periplasmic adaptor subunit [Candidatus Baltobacteraceae bacterium]